MDLSKKTSSFNLSEPLLFLDSLEKFYGNSKSQRYWADEFFPPYINQRIEKIFKPRAKFISEKFDFKNFNNIGDIGAGFGLFLDELALIEPDKEYYAIEPNDKMEKICGIDSETIKQVARLYAKTNKGIIFWGMGVSQHVHGTDNARC